jgi:signal transduction histidine kinase
MEKEKRSDEVIMANKELAFQNDEKEKRADELIIANKELLFQNGEKEKRAAELIIANKELAFLNREKEKRADELIMANKELAFQNDEKEKRANELIIANKELLFQNEEKEKRAAELIIANKELAFQNKEKEKRAAELITTNIELKRLLGLNADKDRFITILAHDLRSPFSSILGYLNLLVNNVHNYSIDEIEKQIKIVNHSAEATFNLLEDLITWTQSQAGKLPYEPQDLNFTDICVDILKVLTSKAITKKITINHSIPEGTIVFADINMLKSVLRNLVSNAIKFTNDGGQIEITAGRTQTSITITVADNGVGIKPENIDHLFDFTQMHSTNGTAAEKGTGFGLLFCKEFIEKHSGKIWVESELGKGSKFNFMLPMRKN